MKIKHDHNWTPGFKDAAALQETLKRKLKLDSPLKKISLIAGCDVSYDKNGKKMYASVLVFTYPELKLVEKKSAAVPIKYPYIPGLLSFREGPALIKAILKLKNDPDVIMFDGHGVAHTRGFGLASHIGVLFDIPSIGCAKTLLTGGYKEPGVKRGETSDLISNGNVIGKVVRTRDNVKPVFVSIGHRIGLDAAVEITLSTCRGLKLPEPVRQAHIDVTALRTK